MSENQGGLKKKSELLEGEDTLTVCWVEHAFQAMTNNLHQLGHQRLTDEEQLLRSENI